MSTIPLSETVAVPQASFDIPVELHILDQANQIVAARIRHVGPSLFEISCPENLRVGQRLALSHEGRRIEVEVSSKGQSSPNVYSLTVKVVTEELGEVRSELRLPTDLSAMVRVAGETREIPGTVVDMSPSGMGIETKVPIARGSKVCVNLDQGLAFGEIRFCREKSSGVFFSGFLLEEYIGREENRDDTPQRRA